MSINTGISKPKYDPVTDTYRLDYDGRRESSSVAVLRAVAAAVDRCADSFDPPLAAVIDPDALDRLFAPERGGGRCESCVVRFRFQNCLVTVHGHGHVTVSSDRTDACGE